MKLTIKKLIVNGMINYSMNKKMGVIINESSFIY